VYKEDRTHPGRASYTAFSASHLYLKILTELINHDYDMKLNMICIQIHKNKNI